MQNERPPEPPNTPQTIQTEADAQAARLVTERLDEITRRAKRAKRRSKIGSKLIYYFFALAGCLFALRFASGSMAMIIFPILILIGVIISSVIEVCGALWGLPKFDAIEITQVGGVKAIVPLFAVLENNPNKKEGQAIRDALTLLLPQMKVSDASLLTLHARRTIHGWVNSSFQVAGIYSNMDDLRIASLKALEQVGDASAIPIVERLATRAPQTPREEKIRQFAIECLAALKANCGEIETARTLLRASQAEPTDPATLLRPASHAAQTNPAELLRGADSPDADSVSGDNLS